MRCSAGGMEVCLGESSIFFFFLKAGASKQGIAACASARLQGFGQRG